MLRVRRPSSTVLDQLLRQARDAGLTYASVGATKNGTLPSGYRHDVDRVSLGNAVGTFDRAVAAVRAWQAQRGAGIEVVPQGSVVAENETVLLLIGAAGLYAVAPCRVVYVIDESERFQFAYGTLPGHPEEGEVSFEVAREPSGDVRFGVESFSRPVDPFARLARPLARRLQRHVTTKYLEAI